MHTSLCGASDSDSGLQGDQMAEKYACINAQWD